MPARRPRRPTTPGESPLGRPVPRLPVLGRPARSLRTLLFLLVIVGSGTIGAFAGARQVAAADDSSAAEGSLVAALNRDRVAAGLVPVRVDVRLMSIARGRSADMAVKGYFDHTQPDGRQVFDIISAAGITWYGAGEILAWNTWPDLTDSVVAANQDWLTSTDHRAILLSADDNYVGVGLAIAADGRRIWTAVFMKGPDRTAAWARADSPVRTTSILVASTVGVRVSWRGSDVPLQVLTAGLRDFQVERRTDGGSWVLVRSSTTATSMTGTFRRGHRYQFRIRARDRAGNVGSWTAPVGISV